MHEFRSIIADIAELEEFDQWRKHRYAAYEASASDIRLVATAETELLHVSILTAVTAGIANAIERTRENRKLCSALGVYTPTHSISFLKSVERLVQSVLSIDDGAKVQTYLARLDLAARLTRNFEVQSATADGFDLPDAEPMADAWRRAAGAAVQAIGVLAEAIGSSGGGRAKEGTARGLGLLRMAAAGNSPCVDAEGRISIPGWAERRRERRRSVNLPARILTEKRVLSVKILDASPTGLGIECAAAIEIDTEISVLFADNRRLAGRVVWTNTTTNPSFAKVTPC